ncbi:MAG: DMT family transporter [candidate division NC10 bacterium]|nr:DMT family transporter [candidate division NC10 bacterium]MBI4840058.1 DMT family transporter [candidate division NC10 bacterium]
MFLCTLWGGNMVAMKVGLRGVPPMATAGFRFLLATISIVLFARVRRVSLAVEPGLWPHLLALGALFVVQHGIFFLGLNLTSASRSAVFMFTQPVYTVLLAHFLVPGERLTPARAGGILLSFLGLLVVFGERLGGGNWGTLLGDGLVSAAAVGWALQSIYMKHLVSRTEPFVLTLYQMLIALPWFFLANWLFEPRLIYYVDVRIALAFLYHGSLIAGLTFVAWTTLLRRLQVGQLSAFIFLTPISGVLLSRILLGDPITPGLVAGLVLVAAGIAVVNRRPETGRRNFK